MIPKGAKNAEQIRRKNETAKSTIEKTLKNRES